MKTICTIYTTPITNIYNGKLIDFKLVKKEKFDRDMDIHNFYNIKTHKNRMGCLSDVSLYEDLIYLNGERLKILSMIS